MGDPWISILTPVKNGWEFLGLCAEGVFQQTERGWDWWIGINGHGATGGKAADMARVILAKAEKEGFGGRVHVVNIPEAKSKVDAMNTLVQISGRTPWVAVLDCDDIWLPNKLLAQKHMIQKTGASVIGTFCNYFGKGIREPFGPRLPGLQIPAELFWVENPIVNSSAILKRELALWEDRFGLDDYDLWLRILKGGGKFFNIPQILVMHRLHEDSAFNGKGGQDVAGLLAYHKSFNAV
jgi:glycosyltransferase involved in cell wall biosynthesis